MGHDRSAASKKGWEKHRAKYEAAYAKIKEDRLSRLPPKKCKGCNLVLDPVQVKEGNVFCSHSCATTATNIARGNQKLAGRSCEYCGSTYDASYADQKFCKRKCSTDSYRDSYISRWLAGEEHGGKDGAVTTVVRKYLLDKYDNKCSLCSWKEVNPASGRCPLNIDHIDGNSENNRPENLTVLCPNCHSLTPTYGSLNRGNGRRFRHGVRKPEKLAA